MNLEITVIRIETFAPYGEIVPAGSVEEHLMDARIYARLRQGGAPCQPRLRRQTARPPQMPFALHCLQRYRTTRCLCLPDPGSRQLIVVARGGRFGPQDIRAFEFGGHLALNLREDVWFGAFTPLGTAAGAMIIEASAAPVETLVLATPLRITSGTRQRVPEPKAPMRGHGIYG